MAKLQLTHFTMTANQAFCGRMKKTGEPMSVAERGKTRDCIHGVVIPEGGWELPEGEEDEHGEFYMACDCCDYPMHHDCSSIYHNQETGETLCSRCEPKGGGDPMNDSERKPKARVVCTCGSSFGMPLPEGKGLWEVCHGGCDYPSGSCNCYCFANCELSRAQKASAIR